MKHESPAITLETERLCIYHLSFDEMALLLHSTARLERHLNLNPCCCELDPQTEMLFSLKQSLSLQSDALWQTLWVIIERQKRLLVGRIYTLDAPGDDGIAEVGYHIDPPYRRQGYMKEALRCFALWLRNRKEVQQVTAKCLESNLASQRTLARCGFVRGDDPTLWRFEG